MNALQKRMKRDSLVGRVDIQHARLHAGLVGDDPDGASGDPREPHHDIHGVARLHFQKIAEIHDLRDHVADVVALLVVRRHDVVQRRVGIHVRVAFHARRIFQIVEGRKLSSFCAEQHGMPVVFGDEVDHAGVGHVGFGAAQLLRGHALAGDALDHLRAGDEHLRLARLDDEVGQRRAVGRAARAGPADQRDLRHRAGEHHVGVEDLAVAGERIDALLHARAARIVDEDERRAGLQGLLHDLGDLDRVHLAGRTAGDREVLAGQVHQAAADGGRAGHHAVRRQVFPGHAEQRGAVLGEQAGLLEAVRDPPALRFARAPSVCRPCAAFPAGPRRRPAWLCWCACGSSAIFSCMV